MSDPSQLQLFAAVSDSLAAADDRAREHAIDPTRSILLRAPAGSGKTTVLTQRLLCLLANVDSPEEILAITFTRKAAAEMRERVLRALVGEIDTSTSQGKRLRALADAVRKRDAKLGWGLAVNPGRLRIQTIDSFNFWLASQLPVAAKAGGTLTLVERPQELYQRAARRVLMAGESDEALAADVELLFERVDNRWDNVERLLSEMLAKRSHWLPYVLEHDEHALTERVASSLRRIAAGHLERACEQLSASLRDTASALPGVGTLGPDAQHMAAWQQLAYLTLTEKNTWRERITKSLGEAFEHVGHRRQLESCIELLRLHPTALNVLASMKQMPAPVLTGEDANAIQALSRVLRRAAMELQVEFAAAGRVDYTYVAGAARAALTESGLPTDLALRAGLKLRHILIDEFQDTSLTQFELLESLTAGWEPGDGRTLFAVGDPMQSIYQFRDAEVGLFLRARDRGIGSIRLESLHLTRNFRSAPGLVEWTNETCAQLFPAADDVRASAVAFTKSLPARAPQPDAAVSLTLFPTGDRNAEAAFVARQIAEIRKSEPAASIAILVASRAHAPPIMEALAAANIDAIGVDLVPLREISIVRDLVSLLRALHHLADRTAWLAVLRAPWCGVSLATLTELSRRRDELLVWEAMADPARLSRCDAADVARIERVRGVLDQALASRERMPLSEWLEAVWMRLGAPDAYPAEDLVHARAFFHALGGAVARGEWRGPLDIDAIVGDLFAEPRARTPHPVEVMTIHRAKGLEFDHVFLPALERSPNRDREPLLRWLDLPREGSGSDLLMAPVPVIGDNDGGALNSYLKRLTAARGANEQARLVYVALTRARRTLHLTGAPKARTSGTIEPRAGTLLRCLWPAVAKSFAVEEGTGATEAAATAPLWLRRLNAKWQPPAIEEARARSVLPLSHRSLEPPQFSWVGETSRHIGTVVHAALERFATEPESFSREHVQRRTEHYRHQLCRLGVPERELDYAARTVTEALIRTLDDERGRWLFDAAHRDARSELALTGVARGQLLNVIIDRTFIDADGTRWVIDFKTSRHEGGNLEAFLDEEMKRYRPQLERNVALARALGPEPVRAALYFPLLSRFREL